MKRLLVLLFISILASGCAGGHANLDVASGESGENIANSDMAYVLINAAGGDTQWQHTGTSYTAGWNNQEMVELKVPVSWSAVFNEYKYYFVQLKPGTYTMVHFAQDRGRIYYYMTDAARQRNEALKHQGGLYASFTVEKGKINYLGDMKVGLLDGSGLVPLEIKDNSPAALEYLRKKYPGINPAGLFTVRLIRPKN